MPFVDPASGWYSALVPVITYVISYNIGPLCNSTRLYYKIITDMCKSATKHCRLHYIWYLAYSGKIEPCNDKCLIPWMLFLAYFQLQMLLRKYEEMDDIHSTWWVVWIWDPSYKQGLTRIPAWIDNRMPSKEWGRNTNPFASFNGCIVCEWVSNLIPYSTMDVSGYLYWD